MFRLTCEWDDFESDSITGSDLGHMTFSGEFGSVSSNNRVPDQSMMIFISIVLLLDGLRKFLSKKQLKTYEFVGIDSSFSVRFKKVEKNKIVVMSKDKIISRISPKDLIQDILLGVQKFMQKVGNNLPEDDPVYEDLHAALQTFSAFSRKLG